jgi:hypothetical protein
MNVGDPGFGGRWARGKRNEEGTAGLKAVQDFSGGGVENEGDSVEDCRSEDEFAVGRGGWVINLMDIEVVECPYGGESFGIEEMELAFAGDDEVCVVSGPGQTSRRFDVGGDFDVAGGGSDLKTWPLVEKA